MSGDSSAVAGARRSMNPLKSRLCYWNRNFLRSDLCHCFRPGKTLSLFGYCTSCSRRWWETRGTRAIHWLLTDLSYAESSPDRGPDVRPATPPLRRMSTASLCWLPHSLATFLLFCDSSCENRQAGQANVASANRSKTQSVHYCGDDTDRSSNDDTPIITTFISVQSPLDSLNKLKAITLHTDQTGKSKKLSRNKPSGPIGLWDVKDPTLSKTIGSQMVSSVRGWVNPRS
jgi:hypothetical protein